MCELGRVGYFGQTIVKDGWHARGRSPRLRHAGFTLVEIAIVLVIIGLLVGLILRAWEMQVSARVRALAVTASGAQVAYYGFTDRYRRVPGDWNAAAAGIAINASITGGGNDNGRLDNPAGGAAYNEVNGLWEQIGKAGFIVGDYAGTPNTEPNMSNNLAPMNVYNSIVIIGVTNEYEGTGVERLNVVVGRGLPVGVARELDVKLDDGSPVTGNVRATAADADVTIFAGANNWGGREADCVIAPPSGPAPSKKAPPPVGPGICDTSARQQDCNAVVLF
jgi:prepilin-type N-terminal cleavage/methylation domain-containing protein